MQSTAEQFLPTGAASPWQLKRTSTEVTNPISYHDKMHPASSGFFFNSVVFLKSIWWSLALAPSAKQSEAETLLQICYHLIEPDLFLIELPSVGIHILYLTIPTLMMPCKASDKRHIFSLCIEREEKRPLTQAEAPKRHSLAAKRTQHWTGIRGQGSFASI